jgi:hypothetical protein
MTAQAAERGRDTEDWVYKEFTLTGVKAWKGAQIFLFIAGASAGKVTDTPAANTVPLGVCWRTVDATSADALVTVRLPRELQQLEWLVNGDAIAATDRGKYCYSADDQTVQKAPLAGQPFGKIWAVDSALGVLVERMHFAPAPVGTLAAFGSGDTAPLTIAHGAVYDIPLTTANSTISLPTAAAYPDGVEATFIGDGTKNGHTITLRDVATAISAAATASKRLGAKVMTSGGKWIVVGWNVGP